MKGTKIEFLRNIRGYTQEYMAKKCQIEPTRYKRIEAGSVDKVLDDEYQKIATQLGTTVEDLKNPNPYLIINISDSPNSLVQSVYESNVSSELFESLKKKDAQIDSLIKILETKIK